MSELWGESFDDARLVELTLEGQDQAFSVLMSRYKEKAMQLAYLKLGNYADAQDVAQEAFVKMYRALKTFKGNSKFSTWMYRIVMNAANDFLRKHKNKKSAVFKSEEAKQSFFDVTLPQSASPEENAARTELSQKIETFAQNLSEKQRIIFMMRFFEDLKIKEIAEILNVSEGTVKSSIHFATQKFKDEMAGCLS